MPILVVAFGMRAWARTPRVIFFAGLLLVHALLSVVGIIGLLRLSMFIAGILLYECIESRVFEKRLSAAGEIVTILLFGVGLLAVGWHLIDSTTIQVAGRSARYFPVYRLVILSTTIFGLMLYSFSFDGLLKRFFGLTLIRWMGNISYSYYLIHGGSLHAFRMLLQPVWPSTGKSVIWFWALLPIGIAVTVTASTPIFLLVEKRFSLRVKSRESKVRVAQ